jgi:hypothetical protein
MSRFVITFLVTLGAAGWIYTRLQRNSGNNTQQSLTASAIIGAVLFIIIFVVLGMLP